MSSTLNARGLRMAATASVLFAGSAMAADNSAQTATPTTQPSAAVSLNSGVSPHEFSADASKVTLERRTDGTRVYQMNGQGMQAVTVHIGANGKLEYTCTDNAEAAVQNAAAENAHAVE